MKKYLTIISLVVAAFSCTPNLEPEDQEPQNPTEVAVESVVLSTNTLSLQPNEKAYLTGRVYPDNCKVHSVTWTSSNEGVATVSQGGEVTAIAEGTSIVTVNCDGKKDECTVTVAIVKIPVTSVSLDKTTADLLVGETLQLTATVLPDNVTDKTVTWTSSNTEVATVENGLATALTAGEAVITATAEEISANCTVTVTVPFFYGGMCMEAINSASMSISNPNGLTIEYKVENNDWTSSNGTNINIRANTGERVWFRGRNESYS